MISVNNSIFTRGRSFEVIAIIGGLSSRCVFDGLIDRFGHFLLQQFLLIIALLGLLWR